MPFQMEWCNEEFEFFFNVYLFLRQRETEHEQGRSRERGRHRIGNRLQALSCQHRAWRGARTHGPWDHDLSWSRTLNQPSHPGAPRICRVSRSGSFNTLREMAYFLLTNYELCILHCVFLDTWHLKMQSNPYFKSYHVSVAWMKN